MDIKLPAVRQENKRVRENRKKESIARDTAEARTVCKKGHVWIFFYPMEEFSGRNRTLEL